MAPCGPPWIRHCYPILVSSSYLIFDAYIECSKCYTQGYIDGDYTFNLIIFIGIY